MSYALGPTSTNFDTMAVGLNYIKHKNFKIFFSIAKTHFLSVFNLDFKMKFTKIEKEKAKGNNHQNWKTSRVFKVYRGVGNPETLKDQVKNSQTIGNKIETKE